MITSSREAPDFTPKQEGNNSDASKAVAKASTTTSWSRLKDPRIVRVSRAFGGKDRHSKVCTVRGLRDRRIRLSVPTAIQLYDLQDQLGLNQPSKVVDWLLNAAKHEIDELPPLRIPPGNFGQSIQAMLANNGQGVSASNNPPQSDKVEGLSLNWDDPLEISRSNYWNNPDKSKEIERETSNGVVERRDEEGSNKQDHDHRGGNGVFVSSSNFFQRSTNHSPLPGLLNNVMPNSSFLKWDPSNLSLSQFGSYGMITPQTDDQDFHSFNVVPTLPSNLSAMPSGSHQLLLYPPPQTQSYFPSHGFSGEFDPKQFNFQMLSSSTSSQNPLSSSFTTPLYTMSQAMRPNFHLSMNPKLFPSDHDDSGNEPNKGN